MPFILLFSIATAVALLARRFALPYTVALVFAGLILGATRVVEPPDLGQDILYAIFLPGLLFEAAYHLRAEDLRTTKTRILMLAVPGVFFGTVVTAGLLAFASRAGFVAPLPFRFALVFAAVVAATDPIAVVALFKELGAPSALTTVVEGESLLNDGTAVVVFAVVMSVVTGDGSTTWWHAALFFLRVVGLGIAVGGAFGAVVALIMKNVDDAMIEITLTMIAAYGSFAVAERLHGSGVLATVTAGMVCGSYAVRVLMSERTRAAVGVFWEYLAFALNSLVFLLVGFTVKAQLLAAHWVAIVVAFVVSLAARAAVVYSVSFVLRRTREHIPWAWSAVLTWGGLRGALSMVLALALPRAFPYRENIVAMTFGIVILSLFVQGLSIARLLRRLGITAGQKPDAAAGPTAQ